MLAASWLSKEPPSTSGCSGKCALRLCRLGACTPNVASSIQDLHRSWQLSLSKTLGVQFVTSQAQTSNYKAADSPLLVSEIRSVMMHCEKDASKQCRVLAALLPFLQHPRMALQQHGSISNIFVPFSDIPSCT